MFWKNYIYLFIYVNGGGKKYLRKKKYLLDSILEFEYHPFNLRLTCVASWNVGFLTLI